ncbi:MAG TPA: bacteriohopanetetrol glucosamine biosynthesis glycosyltransferase HpnI [Acetobacteraceae bacterium]|nr:bacteriohopanetetrol glucosamine biosynthesis glycosyltransferase HpnI [Acetobacteraceae bacterium]
MLDLLTLLTAILACAGLIQGVLGLRALRRFSLEPVVQPATRPPVTVLKPLFGDEPLLEIALTSFCIQTYPDYQIVFGVQDPADPALAVIGRLRALFPERDIGVVVDPTPHGANRKVANLINMLPAAKHDVLVIADADLHAPPSYLERIVAALQAPGAGLVTTLYTGFPGVPGLPARLGASQINHVFLPGVLLARAMGRQDCLGATMALTRGTLGRIGGLPALAPHLADDNMLGRLVRGQGLRIALARTVPATTVPEASLAALWRHELRWARTIRALVPVQFALSSLQYPLVWALASLALSRLDEGAVILFIGAWALRAALVRAIDRALGLARTLPVWLLPVREVLSFLVLLAGFAGNRVEWRGQMARADRARLVPGRPAS